MDIDGEEVAERWPEAEREKTMEEIGEQAARQNWLIAEQILADKRRLARTAQVLHVCLPDDDTEKVLIAGRLSEIRQMTNLRRDQRIVLLRYTLEQRQRILVSFFY